MLAHYKEKTNTWVGAGAAFLLAGGVRIGAFPLGAFMALAGIIMFVRGCFYYAQGKGHSKWFGFFGHLSIPGLLVLVLLPDKQK